MTPEQKNEIVGFAQRCEVWSRWESHWRLPGNPWTRKCIWERSIACMNGASDEELVRHAANLVFAVEEYLDELVKFGQYDRNVHEERFLLLLDVESHKDNLRLALGGV